MGFEGVSLIQRYLRVAVAVKLTAARAKGGATAHPAHSVAFRCIW
jgi:hypothetical protein